MNPCDQGTSRYTGLHFTSSFRSEMFDLIYYICYYFVFSIILLQPQIISVIFVVRSFRNLAFLQNILRVVHVLIFTKHKSQNVNECNLVCLYDCVHACSPCYGSFFCRFAPYLQISLWLSVVLLSRCGFWQESARQKALPPGKGISGRFLYTAMLKLASIYNLCIYILCIYTLTLSSHTYSVCETQTCTHTPNVQKVIGPLLACAQLCSWANGSLTAL